MLRALPGATKEEMKRTVKRSGKLDFSYYQGTTAKDHTLTRDGDVRIKLMAEHLCPADVLIRDLYFEGGDVLRCYRGRFRFTLEGHAPVVIGKNETIVVYPDQCVTIEALDKVNLLVYTVFEGSGVAAYFDRFGFFNGMHGPTSAQLELFREVKHVLESSASPDLSKLAMRLSDALVTFAHEFRKQVNGLLIDAMRQIRANLQAGSVRLSELCETLGVSRSHLHRCFSAAGLGSVSETIKREQLRLSLRLLRETRLPVSEIAKRTGFLTATHFATFIKRRTGKPPRDLRR